MVDPVSTIVVSAFVVGAAKGAAKVGEQAVQDAYQALKRLVTTTFNTAVDLLDSITGLEKKPESESRRSVLAEELSAAGALDNAEVIAAANVVLEAAQQNGAYQTIGVDWADVRAAHIKLGQIRARAGAIGFRAARSEIQNLEITGIDVEGLPGKK